MVPEAAARRKQLVRTRNYFLSGLAVLFPLVITVLVLRFLFNLVAGILLPVLELVFDEIPTIVLAPMSFLIVVAFVFVIGRITSHVIGQRVVALGERWIGHLPYVKFVYKTSKEVMRFMIADDGSGYLGVAEVDFPQPGMKALGFVTGTIQNSAGVECYKVVIPTTPNPTTGYLQMVPRDRARILDMSTEEAMKFIMSAGLVAPAALNASQALEAVNKGTSGLREPAGGSRLQEPGSPAVDNQ